MKLYVANFPFSMSSKDLEDLFSVCGKVINAIAMRDKNTNAPLGYGFVELYGEDATNRAIKLLNGKEISHRSLKVSLANEDHERKRAYMIGRGTCIMCKKEGELAGYGVGFGICGECARIMSNIHYHNERARNSNLNYR